MGTSTSAAQLAKKIDTFAKAVADPKPGLNAAGLAGKTVFQAQAAGAGVLGSKLAGKRKPINARYDLKVNGPLAGSGAVIVTYTGPAHLVNNPTRPHFITAKGLRGSRRSRAQRAGGAALVAAFGLSGRGAFGGFGGKGAKALTIGPNLRAYARHPGTKGKGFFQRAAPIVKKQAPTVYQKKGLTAPLRSVFK